MMFLQVIILLAGHGAVPEAFGEHIPSGSSPIPVAAPAHGRSEDIGTHTPSHNDDLSHPWARAGRRQGISSSVGRSFFAFVLASGATLPEEEKSTEIAKGCSL